MIEVKFFPIYGLAAGINLYSSDLDDEGGDDYKMIQLLFFLFGVSIIIWDAGETM